MCKFVIELYVLPTIAYLIMVNYDNNSAIAQAKELKVH